MGNFNFWSLLTNWKSESKCCKGNAGNNGINVLQQFCDSQPGGKVNILLREGEMTVQFTWDANTPAENGVYQLYALSGSGHDIGHYTCKEEVCSDVIEEKDGNLLLPSAEETKVQDVTEAKAMSEEDVERQLQIEDLREERKMKRCVRQQIETIEQIKEHVSSNYDIRYNVITRTTEVAEINEKGLNANCSDLSTPLHFAQDDSNGEKDNSAQDDTGYRNMRYFPMDNRVRNAIFMDVKSKGVYRSDREVEQFINSTATREYHPFVEYFKALPEWDGKDRVTALAKRVADNELWVSSFHRWMLAVTAQWMGVNNSEYANSVAPLLISKKQGLGKSTFCRMLVPKALRQYYTDSYDITAQSSCESKLTTFGLICLDEFDRLSDKKLASLKNLMQMNSLNIKRAYKSYHEPLPRIASFIGTTNHVDLLSDPTGSRRFICVEINRMIDCSPVEYEQLYAQLKHELEGGERYWFSKAEEAAIQKSNERYYRSDAVTEIFRACFRETDHNEPYSRYMTSHQVYEHLCRMHKKAMVKISYEKFAKLLPTLATKKHTERGNVYRLVTII